MLNFSSWNTTLQKKISCPLKFNIDAYSANQHLCRRSGQRSRVRKLQYIAELERTVDSLQVIVLIFYFNLMLRASVVLILWQYCLYSFQNMGADLAVRVASLCQLHNSLSMENKQLRIQISTLQHAKLIKDGMSEKHCALVLFL